MQRTASIFVVISMHISKHRHLLYDVQNQLVQRTFHRDPNKRSVQAYFFLKCDKYLPKCWVELSLNTRVTVKFFLAKLKQLLIVDLNSNHWVSLRKTRESPLSLNSIQLHKRADNYHIWLGSYSLHVKIGLLLIERLFGNISYIVTGPSEFIKTSNPFL